MPFSWILEALWITISLCQNVNLHSLRERFQGDIIFPLSTKEPVVVVQLLSHVQLLATLRHTRIPWPSLSPSLRKFMNIESLMPSNHLILGRPFLLLPQSFLASASFPMSQPFASGGQSIGASASAPILPMNIQGWFPLGLTGLVSMLSKGLSWVLSSTTVWEHQFFGTQLSL